VLDLIAQRLDCGRITKNHRASSDTCLVFVVRERSALLNKAIPLFEDQPLISTKQRDFETFAQIVRAMANGVLSKRDSRFYLTRPFHEGGVGVTVGSRDI